MQIDLQITISPYPYIRTTSVPSILNHNIYILSMRRGRDNRKKKDTRGHVTLEKELSLANSINSTESLLLLLCHFLASNPNFLANRQPNLGFPTKISTKQFSRTCRFPLSVFFSNCREQGEPFPWNDKMAEQKKKVKRDSNERLGLRIGSIDVVMSRDRERCKSWS